MNKTLGDHEHFTFLLERPATKLVLKVSKCSRLIFKIWQTVGKSFAVKCNVYCKHLQQTEKNYNIIFLGIWSSLQSSQEWDSMLCFLFSVFSNLYTIPSTQCSWLCRSWGVRKFPTAHCQTPHSATSGVLYTEAGIRATLILSTDLVSTMYACIFYEHMKMFF